MNVVTEGVVFGLFFGHERRPKQPKANLNKHSLWFELQDEALFLGLEIDEIIRLNLEDFDIDQMLEHILVAVHLEQRTVISKHFSGCRNQLGKVPGRILHLLLGTFAKIVDYVYDAFTDLRHFLESPGRAQFGSGNKMALKDLVDRTLLGNITKRAASAHFGIGNSRVVDQNFLFRRRLLRTLPFFACFLFLCV